ncbi:hypothetical protein FBR05_04095 [Deltaproteobacteria bacterium PRO3]|nr:hypothetical protein [Deltaproteobacteria bacterium PRO3]
MNFNVEKLLGYWGAGLSTVLAILKIYDFYYDRVHIKVKVKGGWRAGPVSPYGDKDLILISVCNEGRRSATITKAALLMPRTIDHKYVVCLDSITAVRPVDLTEGKAHDYVIVEDEVKKLGSINPQKYVAVVYDATGKGYWSHGPIRRLWRVGRWA